MAKDVLPALREGLADPDETVRTAFRSAVDQIEQVRGAVPGLGDLGRERLTRPPLHLRRPCGIEHGAHPAEHEDPPDRRQREALTHLALVAVPTAVAQARDVGVERESLAAA